MGFSWSSFVAQQSLLTICSRAGLDETRVLAHRRPVPACSGVFFSLATDDTMIFSKDGPGRTIGPTRRLEAAMIHPNVEKHPGKDENDKLDCTCIGVDLIKGRWWRPNVDKLWLFLYAVLHVARLQRASPAGLLGLLGTAQWFDLLNRGKLSFYDAIYRESKDYSDWCERIMPHDCLREILASAVLMTFCFVDMKLEHLDFAGATDASSEFGLGGCIAKAAKSTLSGLLAASERDGCYVTLDGIVSKPRSRSLGIPHLFGFKLHDFGAIFSYRLTDNEHINLREAHAIIFYLKWLLRSVGRRAKRVILLVDSLVAVGAMQKGRSGSRALNALVRKAHCLCMSGELRLHIVFIPTEHNPADYPSRGEPIPGRRRRKRVDSCCPRCGVPAARHPLDVPRRLRGKGHVCRGAGLGFAYRNDNWVSEADILIERIAGLDDSSALRQSFQRHGLLD